MLDSNILISATIFKSEQMNQFVDKIKKDHTIVLTNLIIEESVGVIARKFPHMTAVFKIFLAELSYDFVYLSDAYEGYDYEIRDEFDKQILHSAYAAAIDILITGDKDFFERTYEGLEILTMAEFLKKY
jgi:putative PIN family toxin of toxin-antitoxin system